MSMDTILAWLSTYWLHSSIALGGMWLTSRLLRGRNLALEEAGWKTALLATLMTATLQLALSSVVEYRPLAGSLELPAEARTEPEVVLSRLTETAQVTRHERLEGAATIGPAQPASKVGGPAAFSRGRAVTAGLFLWLLATSILLTRPLVSYVLLLGHLRQRRQLSNGPHREQLERLKKRAGVLRRVGLSVCAALSVPLALGLRRWEVCLPEKVTEEFDAEERETVLAHELAHLVRYDTLWLLAARVLATAFFFQPLNFLAMSRLRTLSELRCDDWAVLRTGRPVTLAKCLTRVASWRVDHWGSWPVPAMASPSRSQLGARVRRLVSRGYPQPPGRVPHWLKVLALPLVLVFVAAAPAVVEPSRPETAPEVAKVATDELGEPLTDELGEPPAEIAKAPEAVAAPRSPSFAEIPRAASEHPHPPAQDDTYSPPRAPLSPRPTRVPIAAAPALPPRPPLPPRAPRTDSAEAWPSALAAPLAPERAMPAAVPLASARFARLAPDGSFVGSDDATWTSDEAQDRNPAAEPGERNKPPADESQDTYDDELDDLEDALDDELEALEEVLEREVENLEDDLDDHLDELEEVNDERFEALLEEFEEDFEDQVDEAEEEIEVLEERLESQWDDDPSETRAAELERAIERMEESLSDFEILHGGELERIARRFERTVERFWGRDFERSIERALESQASLVERRLESASREMEEASRRLEGARNVEEREQLVAEVRDRIRLMAPSEQELAEIRASVERIQAELAPRMQQFESVQAELRRALEEWRAGYAPELEGLLEQNRETIRGIE